MRRVLALMVALMVALAVTAIGWAEKTDSLELSEYTLNPESEAKLTSLWLDQLKRYSQMLWIAPSLSGVLLG